MAFFQQVEWKVEIPAVFDLAARKQAAVAAGAASTAGVIDATVGTGAASASLATIEDDASR